MNTMGNLEKLGILIIVILVVVVGVVAITPKAQVDRALEFADGNLAAPDDVPPLVFPEPDPDALVTAPTDLPIWPPVPDPRPGTSVDQLFSTPGRPPVVGFPEGNDPFRPTAPPKPTFASPTFASPSFVTPEQVPEPLPRFRKYTVRRGDSLWSIAKRELGSVAKVREIRAANPSLRSDLIRIDAVLQLPTGGSSDASAMRTDTASIGADPTTVGRDLPPSASRGQPYVIRKGDSLSGIAARHLGSASRWREIAKFNRDTLRDPDRLRVGVRILIPGPGTLPLRSSNPVAGTKPATGVVPRSYTVAKGDTLSGIARHQLGREGRWKEIQRLNDGVLKGSDRLRIGMTLELPR